MPPSLLSSLSKSVLSCCTSAHEPLKSHSNWLILYLAHWKCQWKWTVWSPTHLCASPICLDSSCSTSVRWQWWHWQLWAKVLIRSERMIGFVEMAVVWLAYRVMGTKQSSSTNKLVTGVRCRASVVECNTQLAFSYTEEGSSGVSREHTTAV